MNFTYSPKVVALQKQISAFMKEVIYPNENTYVDQLKATTDRWQSPPIMADMKAQARNAGLWNLFLPDSEFGAGLTNLEYAPLCEIMGRSVIAPEVFNCSPPDTGNMELLVRYGTDTQKSTWLHPLLNGTIRSSYAMTEPDVASSDATNINLRIENTGDSYLINGRKWWITGAGNKNCEFLLLWAKQIQPLNAMHNNL